MIWLAALGGGSFVILSLVLGPRLLALSRKTQRLPEFAMGLCLLLMGGLGYPLATIGRAVTALPQDIRGMLIGCSALCLTIGFAALAIFTWKVFRPQSTAAEVATGAALILLAVSLPAEAVWPGLVESAISVEPYPGMPGYMRVVVGLATLYWAGVEAALFAHSLRRRMALGLADPVVADRIFLWAVAISCASINYTTSFALSLVGIDLVSSPVGALVVGTLGMSSTAAAWLAFLPPAAYLRWVERRATALDATPRPLSTTP